MMIKMKNKCKVLFRVALWASAIVGVTFAGVAMAAPTGIGLSKIAGNIDGTITSMAWVLSDVSLLAGIGFIMTSFFKFHQHKLNPTQVPISHGITMLLIGAGLALFPTLIPTASKSVFGSQAQVSKVGGGDIKALIK